MGNAGLLVAGAPLESGGSEVMRSIFLAAALVVGAGCGTALAGAPPVEGGARMLIEAASFDPGPGKLVATGKLGEESDMDVTGSLHAPEDDADEVGKPRSLRGSSEADAAAKPFDQDQETDTVAADRDDETTTGSIDRSSGADKPTALGKPMDDGADDERDYGEEPGKPGDDLQSE